VSTFYTPSSGTMLGSATPDAGGATAVLAASLPDTATISRKSLASDGAGGGAETWSDHATGVACAVDKVGTYREVVQGGRIQGLTVWHARFALGADVVPADRVVVNGETFEVNDTDLGVSSALFLSAQLVRPR
jgi:hypothetical protein